MSTEVHNLVARLKAMGASQAARELEKFSGSVDSGTKSLSQMQLIGGVTAGMLATDLARGLIRATKEGIVMAGQLQTAEAGFTRLTAGLDANVLSLKTLRTATNSMVGDLDLLLAANKSITLGLPTDQMNELFEVARRLGPMLGRDVTEAVNDLSMGIARKSKMILDNLGIVISLEEAYAQYASTLGKTAGALTAAEQTQAVYNAAMAQATKVTDAVGDVMSEQQTALQQANAAWKNLQTTIGTIAGVYIGFAGRLVKETQNMGDVVVDLGMDFATLDGEMITATSNIVVATQEAADAIEDLGESSATATRTAVEGFVYLSDHALIAADALERMTVFVGEDYVDALQHASQESTGFFEESMEVIKELKEEAEALKQTQLEEEFLAPLEEAMDANRRKMDELNLEMMKLNRSLDLGTISQETYDAEAQRIRSTIEDLRIAQAELRLGIQDTTLALEEQGEAFTGLGETTGAGVGPFTFDFASRDPLLTGVTGGGGRYQVMAMGGARGATRTTSITVNLTGEQIAGKTRAEIRELARQLAEEMAKEMRIRGVTS